ncbi:helix-turn-helix transcriptional regulator [Sphingobium sp. EM0848]|uniref:helix-turn-helix transcriptional regulator n=1 Tax=Sphingobium sp. EM0848 TaxID=2743473 RepID=UPI00159CA4ED|nr:AraC family transcriptional regulator [Sphingobium sp. EM0848]
MTASTSWNERRLATTTIDDAVVRLCEPQGGKLPPELSGCEQTYQIGMWLSDVNRPHGYACYGSSRKFVPMSRFNCIPAGVDWKARLSGENPIQSAIYCDFEAAFFEACTGIASYDSTDYLEACFKASTPLLERTLWMMADEVGSPGFAHLLAVDGLSRLALAELGRSLARHCLPTNGDGVLAGWQLARIREYAEEAEGHAVTLTKLTELCGVSPSHLRRLFKATTGTTITRYVEDIRLRRARTLLIETQLPLKQIAYKLGFSGPSAFSAAFKRATGVAPHIYRKTASNV